MDKVTRQRPQTTTFLKRKESRSGIAYQPNALPLGQTGSRSVGSTVTDISTRTSEGADRVGGQLRGDKECPFSGVTKSGRVWRKVAESDARSVLV